MVFFLFFLFSPEYLREKREELVTISYSKPPTPPTPPTSSFLPSYPRFLNTLRFCFTFFFFFFFFLRFSAPLSLSLHNSILFFPPPAHGPPPHFPSAGRRAGDFFSFGQKKKIPPQAIPPHTSSLTYRVCVWPLAPAPPYPGKRKRRRRREEEIFPSKFNCTLPLWIERIEKKKL